MSNESFTSEWTSSPTSEQSSPSSVVRGLRCSQSNGNPKLTSTTRAFPSHVEIGPDAINGLRAPSWALVEQMRAVAVERCSASSGNIGPAAGRQVLDILAMITGMP